jgi:hypothetical protein
MDYADLLRHPKWQKKRLEIMHLWRCSGCNADDVPLNVHHRRYIRGRKPWEYSNDDLIALCDDCHNKTHEVHTHYKTLTTTDRTSLLDKIVGEDVAKHKWGPFLIFREPKICDGCVIFHIPSGLWHAFSLSPELALHGLEEHPESRTELLQMILEGPSADYGNET